MRIDIITVLPEMLEGFFNCSIMSRAQKKGIAEIHIHNLRDYAYDRYRKVDDYPFGGFAGNDVYSHIRLFFAKVANSSLSEGVFHSKNSYFCGKTTFYI